VRCPCSWRSGAGLGTADVAGLGEDLRGVDGSDPVDLQQGGRVLGQHLRDALLQLLQLCVQPFQLGGVVQGELLAALPTASRGRTVESSARALAELRCRFAPPGIS
jgi:hypothetical protein